MNTAHRFTATDLEVFPDDGKRYEVIDGDLYVSAAPHNRHQAVLTEFTLTLGHWNAQSGLGYLLLGPGIIFASDTAVIPDLVWVSNTRLPIVFRGDGKLHAAPDIVVEILSPGVENERRDREVKLKLYSRQGVQEYWLIDWVAQTVQVYRRVEAVLQLALTLGPADQLASPLLPNFAVTVGDLFRLPPVAL